LNNRRSPGSADNAWPASLPKASLPKKGTLATKGVQMRFFAYVCAICALSHTAAIAQTGECKPIADPTARLACYDRASPVAAPRPAVAKPMAGAPARARAAKIDSGKYIDTIGAEDALMNARLRNICRGC
jgi:hypothetical protein